MYTILAFDMFNKLESILNHTKYSAIIIFCLSLFSVLIYIPNLYFDTHGWQDYEFINDASSLPVNTLIQDIFFPGLDFFGGEHAQGVRSRIVQAFVLKTIHFLFGSEPFSYYFFKGITVAFAAVLIFLMLKKSTKSFLFSFLGVLFFISLPSLFASMLFMYDFDILTQCLVLLVFFLFLNYEHTTEHTASQKETLQKKTLHPFVHHSAIIILTILALKTKVSAIIIPFVLFMYLSLFRRKRFTAYILYFIIAFLFSNPLYPLLYDEGNRRYDEGSWLGFTPTFRAAYLYERLFLNKAWDYNADQTIPSIFSLKESITRVPNTVFGSFGFFFFWFSVLAGSLFLIKKRSSLKNEPSYVFLLFFTLWFLSVLFFYQFNVSQNQVSWGTDLRFLTIAILPVLLFIFTFLHVIYREISFYKKQVSALFIVLLLFSLSISLSVNAMHSYIRLRGGYNARNFMGMQTFELLYQDYYHKPVPYPLFVENNAFYRAKLQELRNITFTNYDFLDFASYYRPLQKESIDRLLLTTEKVYLISLGETTIISLIYQYNTTNATRATVLGIVNPCTEGIFETQYCKLYQRKHNKPFIFYVVKIRKNFPQVYD